MIKIIAVGKVKDKEINALIDDFTKRFKIEVVEVKDEKVSSNKDVKSIEAKRILEKIKDEFVIACDEHGKDFTSIDFAKYIKKKSIEGNIVFIIGGPLGLGKEVLDRADLILTLSKMTFPHKIFRLFLIEQLYRVYAINKGIDYHK